MEVILHCHRMRHARFTHTYILGGGTPPEYLYCNSLQSFEHFLVNCQDIMLYVEGSLDNEPLHKLLNDDANINVLKAIKRC